MGLFSRWFGPRPEPVPLSDEEMAERLLRRLETGYTIDSRIIAARELGALGRSEAVERMLAVYREDPDGISMKEALQHSIDALDPDARKTFETKFYGLDADRETQEKVRQLFRNDLLDRDRALQEAIDHVRGAGERGSYALAHLIEKQICCRSQHLLAALYVAQHAMPTPDLTATLRSVAHVPQSKEGRWPPGDPEIVGPNRYGWADETYRLIQEAAVKALTPGEPQ